MAACLAASALAAQTASELQVTPETMTLGVGQKQPIFASAYDRQGNFISSAKFTFLSSDTTIAKVSKDGAVLGVAPGLAKVEARLQGKRASLAVLVNGPGPGNTAGGGVALVLDPPAAVLLPGESVLITPHALREDGTPLPLDKVQWKSLKPEVATVDSTGLVVGVAPGRSILQANSGAGLMATVPVDVELTEIALEGMSDILGPEDAETLHVRVPAQGNREVSTGVQWRSADTAIAVIGPDGIVQARQPGRTELVVSGFGQERRTGLTVHRLPQVLVVSPKPPAEPLQIPLRAAREFTAVAQAADSTPIPEARIAWEVGDTGVIGFDRSTGALSARDTGSTTLTARLRGFEPVVWKIHVIAGTLGLDRTRAGLRLGERVTLAANLLDEGGKVIAPATGIEWSTDRTDVVAVAGGEVRALSPGKAVVSAAIPGGGKPVSADIFVTADLLVSSNRSGAFGIYQLRPESPDTLLPVLMDGGGQVQAMRSPDRTRIAFSSSRAGSFDLYLADADGHNPRRLTTDPGAEGDPVWTPDGLRIVYTAAPRAGVPQIMSIQTDGTDPRPITASPGGNRTPDVSPDGHRVAFVSTRDGNPEIYEAGIDGGEARRLTRTGDREASPRYLPGGDLLYVLEKSKARILRLAAGASAPVTVLEVDQPVIALDVSRDGERVAYVAGKLAEAGKGKSQLTLRIETLGAGSTPLLVPLRPGEQVLSPSF